MKMHRVLIVDDSPTMRALIANSLSRDSSLIIAGEAGDPYNARDAIKQLNPDVITLDIEMPKMNGLDFLEKIMQLRPTPVVVVSSLTQRGAEATIRALEIGAVDCIAKPSKYDFGSFDGLCERVKAAARISLPGRVRGGQKRGVEVRAHVSGQFVSDGKIVAVGSSMGGVEALCTILSAYPENGPPTVITQHMPALFTKSFASRLDGLCEAQVREAEDGAPLLPGFVYVAPGGARHLEISGSKHIRCCLRAGDVESGHRPSIDVLFKSVSRTVGEKSIGVILTGMGSDGTKGLLAMHATGAPTIGQDEASSLVYGMPRSAFEAGAVRRQLPLRAIGQQILNLTNALGGRNNVDN